jgi:hypothetical protein
MRIGGAILLGNTCANTIISNLQKLRTVLVPPPSVPYVTFQGQGVIFGGTVVSWQNNTSI